LVIRRGWFWLSVMASLSLARPGFAQDDVDRLAIATSLFAEAQSLV